MATAFQGASVYGNLPVAETSSFDYEIFYGNIELNSSDFLAYLLQGSMGGTPMLSYDAECEYAGGGALIWNTPLEGLRVGGSILTTKMNTRANFSGPVPEGGMLPSVMSLELMLDMMGTRSLGTVVGESNPFSGSELDTTRGWLRSKANSIEGGTSEVQLNIIAKRVLGLPD